MVQYFTFKAGEDMKAGQWVRLIANAQLRLLRDEDNLLDTDLVVVKDVKTGDFATCYRIKDNVRT